MVYLLVFKNILIWELKKKSILYSVFLYNTVFCSNSTFMIWWYIQNNRQWMEIDNNTNMDHLRNNETKLNTHLDAVFHFWPSARKIWHWTFHLIKMLDTSYSDSYVFFENTSFSTPSIKFCPYILLSMLL
jgi:hypothetical protein